MSTASNSRPRAIAVFGGSRVDRDSDRYAEAYAVGALLAQRGFTVINGGYAGTMEASARGAYEAGGHVIGVTSPLFNASVMNDYVREEVVTKDLHDRIRQLVIRSDGYIVLRGSIGTLAELHLVWNLAALEPGFNKPIVLLGDAWREVVAAYDRFLGVNGDLSRHLRFASTPEECVSLLTRLIDGDNPLPPAPSPPQS